MTHPSSMVTKHTSHLATDASPLQSLSSFLTLLIKYSRDITPDHELHMFTEINSLWPDAHCNRTRCKREVFSTITSESASLAGCSVLLVPGTVSRFTEYTKEELTSQSRFSLRETLMLEAQQSS